jgi:hypothetical protein
VIVISIIPCCAISVGHDMMMCDGLVMGGEGRDGEREREQKKVVED